MSSKLKGHEILRKQSEVANKVKEMKLRQQNWMKQRDNSKTYRTTGDKNAVKTCFMTEKKLCESKQKWPRDPDIGLSVSDKKKKFTNWKQAREIKDEAQSSDDGTTVVSDESGEINILRVPSVQSSQYASPSPGLSSDSEEETDSQRYVGQLLSPQNFDDLANKIITRVKKDLKISAGIRNHAITKMDTSGFSHKQKMSSHYCIACQALMIPPANTPVILIPCGHTVCQVCADRKQCCTTCDCHVTSRIGNTQLQQIIMEFHSSEITTTSVDVHSKSTYSAGNYMDSVSQNGFTVLPLPKSESKRDYKEKYKNLATRQEFLQQEARDISTKLELLSKQRTKQKQQIRNIVSQEHKITEEIKLLEEKLQSLLVHRQGYEQTCEDLDQQEAQERQRLLLIQKTLHSLDEETDKVRFLAGYDD